MVSTEILQCCVCLKHCPYSSRFPLGSLSCSQQAQQTFFSRSDTSTSRSSSNSNASRSSSGASLLNDPQQQGSSLSTQSAYPLPLKSRLGITFGGKIIETPESDSEDEVSLHNEETSRSTTSTSSLFWREELSSRDSSASKDEHSSKTVDFDSKLQVSKPPSQVSHFQDSSSGSRASYYKKGKLVSSSVSKRSNPSKVNHKVDDSQPVRLREDPYQSGSEDADRKRSKKMEKDSEKERKGERRGIMTRAARAKRKSRRPKKKR